MYESSFPPVEAMDPALARALLEWQVEMGATEALCDAPVDRTALDPTPAKPALAPAVAPPAPKRAAPPADALLAALAKGAQTLEALSAELAALDLPGLTDGARQMIFAQGTPGARVMVLTEPPSGAADRAGAPFAESEAALFTAMFAAIDLAPEALYVAPVSPWRLLNNAAAQSRALNILRPILARHVALAAPEVVVLMGNLSCQAAEVGPNAARLRGRWIEAFGRPALALHAPAALLARSPLKREAWADLLELAAHLETKGAGA